VSDTDNTLDNGQANRYPGTITSSLLGGIKESQEEAWARMSLLYAPLVYLWCRQTGLQASDADDVVQEVLRTVASRVGQFERNRAEGSFRGWLRTITRNKLGDFIRADRRRQQVAGRRIVPEDFSATNDSKSESAGEGATDETRFVFNRVLKLIRTKCEEPTWRAFLRVVLDGASPRDVAEELNMSVESVYQAKSRVLRRIRDELRELGD
jgi:RNA polymerase sigma-70 factor (ECF subfamily)